MKICHEEYEKFFKESEELFKKVNRVTWFVLKSFIFNIGLMILEHSATGLYSGSNTNNVELVVSITNLIIAFALVYYMEMEKLRLKIVKE